MLKQSHLVHIFAKGNKVVIYSQLDFILSGLIQTINMQDYLKDHAITQKIIDDNGLVITGTKISIPIRDEKSNHVFFKHRVFNNPSGKYLYDKGGKVSLFNIDKIKDDTKIVQIVEGEFDAMVLQDSFDRAHAELAEAMMDSDPYKTAAVSSTGGAGTWNEDWNVKLHGKRVAIILDSDEPGIKGAIRLYQMIRKDPLVGEVTLGAINKKIGDKKIKDFCEAFGLYDLMPHEIVEYNRDWLKTIDPSWLSDEKPERKMKILYKNIMQMQNLSGSYDEYMIFSPFKDMMREEYYKIKDAIAKAKAPKRKKAVNHDHTIEEIRTVPIEKFVKFNHEGKACCVFHSEKHPSMHLNNVPGTDLYNTVKCFSCGKFGSVIDVVMALNNTDVKGAVDILKAYL